LSVYTILLEPTLSKILEERKPRHPPSTADTKEKMFPAFQICARPIFSEKGKDIFSLVFCPPSIRAGGRASIRTRFCENNFLGKRISQNLGSDFPPAGGVWGGMRAGFQFRILNCVGLIL